MKESDKLYPEMLKAQELEIRKKLINDNYNLDRIGETFDKFIGSEKFKGRAYDSMRQQFQDYKFIFEEIKNSNLSMIEDCLKLRSLIGNEIYDGAQIFAQQNRAMADKRTAQIEASNWRAKKNSRTTSLVSWYYEQRARACDEDANRCQRIYDALMQKRRDYNSIEAATINLFNCSSDRAVQMLSLQEIVKSFSDGSYYIDEKQQWRFNLRGRNKGLTPNWDTEVINELHNMGINDEEISSLRKNGVTITKDDLKIIKSSRGTKKAFFSHNKSAVIYSGKIYYVNSNNPSEGIDSSWELVSVKQSKDLKIDFSQAFTGLDIDNIGADGNVYDSSGRQLSNQIDLNNTMAYKVSNGLFMLNGLLQIADNSSTVYNAKMTFETNGVANRVSIVVGNNDRMEKMQAIDYSCEINLYKDQFPYAKAQDAASTYAANIYMGLTGNDIDENENYSVVSKLDERHKDDLYMGYLYYNNNELMCKPFVYSGDTAYIGVCDSITGDVTKKILDISDKIDAPYPALQYEKLLENALNN